MTKPKRRRLRHAAIAVFCLALLSVFAPRISLLARIERASLDWRYRNFNRNNQASSSVIVIDIDEASIKILSPYFGRWPFARRVYTELLNFLAIGEPRKVLFDILFTEHMLGTDEDRILFEASRELGNVSHCINLLEERGDGKPGLGKFPVGFPERFALPIKALDPRFAQKKFLDAVVYNDEMMPLISKIHVATFPEDPDGVFRRAPLVFKIGDYYLPSLALAGQVFSNTAQYSFNRALEIRDGPRTALIPTDDRGYLPIHYYSLNNEPKSIPIANVFDSARRLQAGEELKPGSVSPFDFKDKVVIIGASAVGAADLKITPTRSAYPGALIQATAVSNILSNDYLRSIPPLSKGLLAILIALGGYAAVLFIESFVAKIAVCVVGYSAYAALATFLFHSKSLDIGLGIPLFVSLVGIFEGLLYLGVIEGREKRRMQSTLSKYLSPEVTRALIETGQDPQAEVGCQREITILFTDIRSFTTISEAHAAPVVVHHLNNYLGRMTDIIFEESGTLDKFVGDAIMAFWGAPLENPKHAVAAVRCALRMQSAVETLRKAAGKDSPFAFKTGIGINTGPVVVGNIGSSKRLDYTVIGDNVNLAARIESVTKDFRSPLLIGEATFHAVKDDIICRLVDEHVQIKGKKEYIKLFQPLAERADSNAKHFLAVAEEFESALSTYRSGKFELARALFAKLNLRYGGKDGACSLFIERCDYWIENPPKDWDGFDRKASGGL